MENPLQTKSELRRHFLSVRKALSEERRRQAAADLAEMIPRKGRILSFIPMGSEIDLSAINQRLAREHRLSLPVIQEDLLVVEPNLPIDCILVPGLAFDRRGFRLGYGKGHFDRFLLTHPKTLKAGVGFKEQLSKTHLPQDSWDIPVDVLWLF